MRIVYLNTWGGRVSDKLFPYLQEMKGLVDIYLFQEIFNSNIDDRIREGGRTRLYLELSDIFKDSHVGYFSSSEDCIDDRPSRGLKIPFGLATFIKNTITPKEWGDFFVFKSRNSIIDNDSKTFGRNVQYFKIPRNEGDLMILNYHGMWNGNGKTDTPERLAQSEKIKLFLDKTDSEKILGGDFNLEPDTQSLAIVEEGMINLVKKFNITSTRTDFYQKPVKHADYVLVSPGVKVKSFKVPNIPISDHRPLILDIE